MTTTVFAVASFVTAVCCVCSVANILTTKASEKREVTAAKISQSVSGKSLGDGLRIAKQSVPSNWKVLTRPITGSPLDVDLSSNVITLVYTSDGKVVAVE